MAPTLAARLSEVTDPDSVRFANEVLGSVLDELAVDGDAPRQVLTRHLDMLCGRLSDLEQSPPEPRPVVLDPGAVAALQSTQGQPLSPLITQPIADTRGLSSAQVWMPPGHSAKAHVHHYTDVAVIVLLGTAITFWWDEAGQMQQLRQSAGQHIHIPPGVPHAAVNATGQPVVGAEFRNNSVFNADNDCLPELDGAVATRLANLIAEGAS